MRACYIPWLVLLICADWSCKGEVQRVDDARIIALYDVVRWESGPGVEGGTPAGDLLRYDATANPGDPCTFAECAEGMICMANICRKKCTQTICHSLPTECEVDERCVYGSDFTGACLPATHTYGELCDQRDWLSCAEGTLCIVVSGAPARCILVCEDNSDCPGGIECKALNPPNQMCKVCPE